MDMNNKENENVEVLDEFVVDSSSQTNVESVSAEPVLDSSNVVSAENTFESAPMPAVEPVAPFTEEASIPTVEPVAAFDEPAPVPAMEPVAPAVEPVSMPEVEPTSDPVMAAVDNGMDLMSDFPTTTEPEVSEPVVEAPTPIEPVVPVAPEVEQQSVEVESVVSSEPVVDASVNATLESTNAEYNVGINSDQTVTPDYDPTAPVTQASEQQKVKGGKNDNMIFIAIMLIIIVVAIIAIPFVFKALM